MKDENLGKDKNTTYPMDKIGTHEKNVDEVSNTINSENIGKVTNPTKAKVNKIDSKNIDNRKAGQHNKNRSLDRLPADTLDLDQLRNLKDKNISTDNKDNIESVQNKPDWVLDFLKSIDFNVNFEDAKIKEIIKPYGALFEDAKAKLKKSKDEDALFKDTIEKLIKHWKY